MTDTFTWKVTTAASGTGDFAVRESKFGDGYSQIVPAGINNEAQTWNVELIGRDRAGNYGVRDPLAFLRARKGGTSFFWKPPLGVQGYYVCKGYGIRDVGGGLFSLTAKFEQVFYP
jgi:phage-related protein